MDFQGWFGNGNNFRVLAAKGGCPPLAVDIFIGGLTGGFATVGVTIHGSVHICPGLVV